MHSSKTCSGLYQTLFGMISYDVLGLIDGKENVGDPSYLVLLSGQHENWYTRDI